ncbi:MAG TPA: 6-phosphogluconolactonase [Bryobacteraceae bacterium]|nr:6-phosphogluconolactonase [Bryobacteraceae bacterium]HPT26663.1 6-phosphogluconolactonase [Bryobacteraceae bacterium]
MSQDKHLLTDPASACRAAADCIAGLLNDALERQPSASLAVSGGRTPAAMFDSLAVASGLDWSRVHLFFVDERAVPPDHEQSNYGMTLKRLIEPASIPPPNVHRIAGELPPHESARRYGHDIRALFGFSDQELPRFDVIQLGVGADGHTASLFPGDPYLENRESLAAAVYAESVSQWRVTLLPGVLLAAKQLVVLACGEAKAEPLWRAWHGEPDPMRCPAQLIAREATCAEWFLDLAAAAKLL